ncbi:hypothetical protein MMU07_08255 [Aquiflexum sp. LQ15W]|uniref:hypothetical protein n=1 Tax=Cognataquiflexum nitidum TaxID=2922272 RepID=UPI001F1292CB|nr:hypothetical protein [Cognataquiflexum nitidum]MCH6199567.1 hypothetical protein [Cognataquiflexum nitidum]
MGYLPIIITLSCFIGLFWLVVNQSFVAKKKAIMQLQQAFFEGLEKSGSPLKNTASFDKDTLQRIDSEYHKAKTNRSPKNESTFEKELKPVYQSLKITVNQYNNLIGKKPYSFVAKGMGHRYLG